MGRPPKKASVSDSGEKQKAAGNTPMVGFRMDTALREFFDKEAAKDKDAPKEPLAGGDRVEVINRAISQMKKDATDRGLLMISAENFGHMVGFRKARSATQFVRSGFNPAVPNAGIANIEAGPRPGGAAPMNEEKKVPAEEKN